MKEIPDVITASEARLLRKELTKQSKPAKERKSVKKSDHTKALNAADKAFSLCMRATWADEYGNVVCSTCGKLMKWKEPDGSSQTGHWMSRGCNRTRFNVMNVAPQCLQDNYFKEGMKERMRVCLEKRFGKDEILKVEAAAQSQMQISDFELKQIAKYYREEARKIIKQKGLI